MVIKESQERENIWIQIFILFGWALIISHTRAIRFLTDEPFCWFVELELGLPSANRVLSPASGRNNSCSHAGRWQSPF